MLENATIIGREPVGVRRVQWFAGFGPAVSPRTGLREGQVVELRLVDVGRRDDDLALHQAIPVVFQDASAPRHAQRVAIGESSGGVPAGIGPICQFAGYPEIDGFSIISDEKSLMEIELGRRSLMRNVFFVSFAINCFQ